MTDLRITVTGVVSTAELEALLEQYPMLTLDDVSLPKARTGIDYPGISI